MTEPEPVTWLKHKYSTLKQKGGYKSGHNDNGKSTRKKTGAKNTATRERVLILRNSKRHWEWR